MKLKPDLQVSGSTAQAIVDRVVAGQAVAKVSKLHGGEIAAVYAIDFADPAHAPLVLKVYPDELHWKMQKEVTVVGLIQNRVGVSVPRILLASNSKRLLDLNFTLMNKLDGSRSWVGWNRRWLPRNGFPLYAQIGQLLREFHRIQMEAFGYIGPTGIWTAHSSRSSLLDASIPTETQGFCRPWWRCTTSRSSWPDTSPAAQSCSAPASRRCYVATICHAGNLLVTDMDGSLRLSGVLDFEGALAGDPLMDVAEGTVLSGRRVQTCASWRVRADRSIALASNARSLSSILRAGTLVLDG